MGRRSLYLGFLSRELPQYAEALRSVQIGRQETVCMPTRSRLESEGRKDLVDLVLKCGGGCFSVGVGAQVWRWVPLLPVAPLAMTTVRWPPRSGLRFPLPPPGRSSSLSHGNNACMWLRVVALQGSRKLRSSWACGARGGRRATGM